MLPRPIKCAAELPDGSKCDEFAIVTSVHYVYDRQPMIDEPNGYNLNKIHYHAVCPKCGERKLIEKPKTD